MRESLGVGAAARSAWGVALALVLGTGCGGGGSDTESALGPGGELRLLSCSLGCSGTGETLGCALARIHVNEEIVLSFDRPIDPASVDAITFGVTQSTGAQPLGSYEVDPLDPRRVRFRPQLSFDSAGNPNFGLEAGGTYRLDVPGILGGGGAGVRVIEALDGSRNRVPLQCQLVADLGISDGRPGPPAVDVFFDVATVVEGEVVGVEQEVLANGGTLLGDVYRNTRVKLVFDDLMNPATLVNPLTGETPFLSIGIDPDGNPFDPSDQVPLEGSYALSLDSTAFTTTLTFEPLLELPSAGVSAELPRLLVVRLPSAIQDLGGNALANAGNVVGVPERRVFARVRLPVASDAGGGETFDTTTHLDAARSGAPWGAGELRPGTAGGSGRLGDLTVTENVQVIRTDSQFFPAGNLLDNYDPLTGLPLGADDGVLIEDGVFEFSSLRIPAGNTLRLEGSLPGRIFVRGTAQVAGTLDLAGEGLGGFRAHFCEPLVPLGWQPPTDLDCDNFVLSLDPFAFEGQFGGVGGPGAGRGGDGGDMPDADETLQMVFGIDNPSARIELDGADGEGVVVPNALAPTGRAAGGSGGVQWPRNLPPDWATVADVVFEFTCVAHQAGACGGGGGYATPGGFGITGPVGLGNSAPLAPWALGGDSAEIGGDPLVRTLDPALGYLRGGSGGGGGGSHVARSGTVFVFGSPFSCTNVPAGEQVIDNYFQARSAAGGGGGGALQLQATRLNVDGVIDASGGRGGSRTEAPEGFPVGLDARTANATAGGGGSGGALLLQAPTLAVAGLPGRLSVAGGAGGLGVGTGSSGGQGGAGYLRVESGSEDTVQSLETLAELVSPQPSVLATYPSSPAPEDVVSIVAFEPDTDGPGSRSGAQSCWLSTGPNAFSVDYLVDADGELGWDMTVRLTGGQEVSYRSVGAFFEGVSLETVWGNELGSSPLVVRFQGVRATGSVADLCNVDAGLDGPLLPGSLSPWARHPSELSDFSGVVAERPNLIRFQIVFDASHPLAGSIEAVTSLYIEAQPE